MNTRFLMDQLMKSGAKMLQDKHGKSSHRNAYGRAPQSSGLGGIASSIGGSALASTALSMLLGGRKRSKMSGKLFTYGGLGALGVVAYQAYSKWQQQNRTTAPQGEPRTVDRVPEAQAEEHSHAILRAVIGAAKADGHIDDRERQLIDEEIAKLAGDTELVRWFNQELHRPLDPADIARAASTPEIAAEMYLASRLVIDDENFMERTYLEELARQLKLDAGLKAQLDAEAVS